MDNHPSQPVTSSPFASWPRPLAFVLSGGGAFGPVHVGMLAALFERGIQPDLVVGTSVGALHGAMVAATPADERPDLIDRLRSLWLDADRRSLFGGRRAVVRNLVRHRTLADGSLLGRIIDANLSVSCFEDLPTPFAAVATDALTGEPELLSSGPLKAALLASAAIPGAFPPVDVDGRLYIDGGVAANVPIRQAISFSARSVITLDATPPVLAERMPTSFSGAVLHTMSLMLRSQRANSVDELAHRYPIAELPSTTPPDMGNFNFDRTAELLETSYRRTAETLDAWLSETADSHDLR